MRASRIAISIIAHYAKIDLSPGCPAQIRHLAAVHAVVESHAEPAGPDGDLDLAPRDHRVQALFRQGADHAGV